MFDTYRLQCKYVIHIQPCEKILDGRTTFTEFSWYSDSMPEKSKTCRNCSRMLLSYIWWISELFFNLYDVKMCQWVSASLLQYTFTECHLASVTLEDFYQISKSIRMHLFISHLISDRSIRNYAHSMATMLSFWCVIFSCDRYIVFFNARWWQFAIRSQYH